MRFTIPHRFIILSPSYNFICVFLFVLFQLLMLFSFKKIHADKNGTSSEMLYVMICEHWLDDDIRNKVETL